MKTPPLLARSSWLAPRRNLSPGRHRFKILSKEGRDYVWNLSNSRNADMIVLMSLADRAADRPRRDRDGRRIPTGGGYFTLPSLAKRCRLGQRTVEGAIAKLRLAKELEITDSGRGPGARFFYMIPAISTKEEPADSAPSQDDESPQILPESPQILPMPIIDKPELNRKGHAAGVARGSGERKPRTSHLFVPSFEQLLELGYEVDEAKAIDEYHGRLPDLTGFLPVNTFTRQTQNVTELFDVEAFHEFVASIVHDPSIFPHPKKFHHLVREAVQV